MDNLKYYNDSLAYDFEMFMPRPAQQQNKDNIVKLPQIGPRQRAKKRAAVRSLSVSAFAVMATVFMVAAMCGNIFLRLQINEVNSKINDVKKEINVLQSERTGLEVEFERVISYSNFELESSEIFMKKIDYSLVKYFMVNDKNSALTKDGETISGKDN